MCTIHIPELSLYALTRVSGRSSVCGSVFVHSDGFGVEYGALFSFPASFSPPLRQLGQIRSLRYGLVSCGLHAPAVPLKHTAFS